MALRYDPCRADYPFHLKAQFNDSDKTTKKETVRTFKQVSKNCKGLM